MPKPEATPTFSRPAHTLLLLTSTTAMLPSSLFPIQHHEVSGYQIGFRTQNCDSLQIRHFGLGRGEMHLSKELYD